MMKGVRGDRRGFTLIELLVVVTILGVLVAIAIPAVGGYVDDAKKKAARADAKNIQTALIMYKAEYGAYPASSLGDTESDYSQFRAAIARYVSLPQDEDGANFDFKSYAIDPAHGFYVLLEARDHGKTKITIYQEDIIAPK